MGKGLVACNHLKDIMAERGITIDQLSILLGVSLFHLRLKIDGEIDWMFEEMVAIKKVFNLPDTRDVFPELYDSVANYFDNIVEHA